MAGIRRRHLRRRRTYEYTGGKREWGAWLCKAVIASSGTGSAILIIIFILIT